MKRKGERALLEDPALEDSDPWFGFGVRHHGVVLDEVRVFEALGDAQTAPVEQLVRALVAFNRENADALEGGLVTHEERETGSAAVQWLVERELRHLNLYIAFLETLDLDHTVAQVDVVLALARCYTSDDLRPLSKWVAEHRVQLLSDWLANDRAWKVLRSP